MSWIVTKGGLISESFSRWLQSPKECAKKMCQKLSWALSTYREDAQDSFWHIFWEIGPKVKNFLRLSHLYKIPFLQFFFLSWYLRFWFDVGIRHTFYIYGFILPYLQINLDSFVSSPKATCNIFTASGRELYAPHTGNKNIINGRFQGRGNTLHFKKTNMRPRQKLFLILLKRNLLHQQFFSTFQEGIR